jgi:hypothetical protein
MNGVSAVIAFELAESEERVVCAGPCVLTSVVACERTGLAPAVAYLGGEAGEGPYYRLRLDPGGTLAFADPVALPAGLRVTCLTGDMDVTVAFR